MQKRFPLWVFLLALAPLQPAGSSLGSAHSGVSTVPSPPPAADQNPLTPEEIRALADRVIAHQHSDDAALDSFERVERHIIRSGGPQPRVVEDKTYRVVPTGTGTLKLLIKENGQPVDTNFYRKQLEAWERVLEIAINPNDPQEKEAYAKWLKRTRERKELVDAARQAFHASWLGREVQSGRTLVVLQLEPNRKFQPRSAKEDVLVHVRAKIWIDEQSSQIARGEAVIIRDVSFGGGILGKLYRGGRFLIEQAEVTPGVWLPARYQYDFSGRKFIFGFQTHETVEIRRYRRLGSPQETLPVVRQELQSGQMFGGDP